MARVGISKAKMLVFGGSNQVYRRSFSRLAGSGQRPRTEPSINGTKPMDGECSPCWVPHPRTGIYFPEGQEWVMDDVPDGAASFTMTYWLRNVDGVDKPDPDVPSNHSFHLN